MENRLSDLWALFDFLNPGLLGSRTVFQSFVKSLQAREENPFAPLRRLVGPYILRRLKTDRAIIDDLPAKTETARYCNIRFNQLFIFRQPVFTVSGAFLALHHAVLKHTIPSLIVFFSLHLLSTAQILSMSSSIHPLFLTPIGILGNSPFQRRISNLPSIFIAWGGCPGDKPPPSFIACLTLYSKVTYNADNFEIRFAIDVVKKYSGASHSQHPPDIFLYRF